MGRNLTFADGQVGTTAASVFTGSGQPNPSGGRVTLVLSNVGSAFEALTLTFSRNGGTARRLAYVGSLAPNEQLVIQGLPVEGSDSILAATSTASSVDYLVFDGKGDDFDIFVLDENMRRRSAPDILEQLSAVI